MLLDYPDDQTVQAFQRNTTHPAMQSLAGALAERGVAARVITEDDALSVRLEVSNGDEPNFSYEVARGFIPCLMPHRRKARMAITQSVLSG